MSERTFGAAYNGRGSLAGLPGALTFEGDEKDEYKRPGVPSGAAMTCEGNFSMTPPEAIKFAPEHTSWPRAT